MNRRILNLGCGKDMYGTDRIDLYKTPATTHVQDLNKGRLPFDDNTFDEVFASGILEHIGNLNHFIDEIYRVLKIGGKLRLHTDSATYIFWHTLKKWEHNNYLNHYYEIDNFSHEKGRDSHIHLFVKSHLMNLFSRFNITKLEYIGHGNNVLKRFIAYSLPFNWGKRQIYMEAIK